MERKTQFQPKLKTLYDKLWDLTRQIIFATHQNGNGGVDCYTCPQTNLEGRNRQCGHGYPDGALSVQMAFDLRILRPQCYSCNMNHGGMGAVFWKNLERDLGKETSDALLLECQGSKGNTTNGRDYANYLIPVYRETLASLQ